jgi:hypothetical protein
MQAPVELLVDFAYRVLTMVYGFSQAATAATAATWSCDGDYYSRLVRVDRLGEWHGQSCQPEGSECRQVTSQHVSFPLPIPACLLAQFINSV